MEFTLVQGISLENLAAPLTLVQASFPVFWRTIYQQIKGTNNTLTHNLTLVEGLGLSIELGTGTPEAEKL